MGSFSRIHLQLTAKECWYFMRVGEEIKNKSETADRLKLAASKQVDDTLRQSLTDQDEGILRPGALPKIEGVSASASKALASSFGQVGPWCAVSIRNTNDL